MKSPGGGSDGDGGGGLGDGSGGVCGGEGGDGGSDGGEGGGEGGSGGKGQAVWQTYFNFVAQILLFHMPPLDLSCMQSRPLCALLGWPPAQLVYDSRVLDGLQTHVPSDIASVPPIHTSLPLAAVSSSAFCAADCTLANCRPTA